MKSIIQPQEALFSTLANDIAKIIHDCVAERGVCHISLSGGRTPLPLYVLLTGANYNSVPWEKVHLWLNDERFVTQNSTESVFKHVADTGLMSRVPKHNLHPVKILDSLEETVEQYKQTLNSALGASALDIAILGVGEDGHIASLFPNHPSSMYSGDAKVIAVNNSPKPPSERISLSLKFLSETTHPVLILSGESKREIVSQILSGVCSAVPSFILGAINSGTSWYIDSSLDTTQTALGSKETPSQIQQG